MSSGGLNQIEVPARLKAHGVNDTSSRLKTTTIKAFTNGVIENVTLEKPENILHQLSAASRRRRVWGCWMYIQRDSV
jgi:hypothetical protein